MYTNPCSLFLPPLGATLLLLTTAITIGCSDQGDEATEPDPKEAERSTDEDEWYDDTDELLDLFVEEGRLSTTCRLPENVTSKVFGGSETHGAIPQGSPRSRATGLIRRGTAVCTGVLVAPNWVLTAKHCFGGIRDGSRLDSTTQPYGVAFHVGDDPAVPIYAFPARTLRTHPDYDLALLEIVQPALGGVPPVVPIPILQGMSLLTSELKVLAAGYGANEKGALGTRRYVDEEILSIDDSTITVRSPGENDGLCFGDSGGPLLATTGNDDNLFVLGVLSEGESSCVGEDQFVRLDTVTDWLSSIVGRLPIPCDSESPSTRCEDGHLVGCTDRVESFVDCSVCGMRCSDEHSKAACVSSEFASSGGAAGAPGVN